MRNFLKTSIVIVAIVLNASAQNTKKVLFVGNSITYFNDMPTLFENIANEKGKNVEASMYAPGGTGFVNHHVDNNVYQLFRDNVWDYVVLQPGSSESAGVSWPAATTAERGNQLQDSIKKYSPCAKIFLYQIPYGVPSETTYSTYFQVQTQIKNVLTSIADQMQIPFIPAGECARQHYSAQQDLLLHNSYNDIHPNLNGSYLVACAMFCTLFQETVSGVVFNGGVTTSNATYFQGIADTVILNNKPLWRLNTYNLHAEFAHQVEGSQVSFTNNSTNYDTLLWDFGDGSSSTDTNPQHNYDTVGNKTITLTATKNDCDDVFVKTVTIENLGLNSFNLNGFTIHPTLVDAELTIDANEKTIFFIYNALGSLVDQITVNNYSTLNVDSYAKGIYFIKSTDSKFIKFIKR